MAMTKYYAIVVPGLERVAWKDIRASLDDVQLIAEESGRLLFEYSGAPRDLLYLRSVENVYILMRSIRGLSQSRKSLGIIFKQAMSADFRAAAMIHKEAHRSKGKKKLTFRVVSNKLGKHNFRRVDAQKAVEKAIAGKCGWRLTRQDPILEARIDVEEDQALLGFKLSSETMRNRTYKVVHLPASLKPTVAYCMVLLSRPTSTDVFVDPMCGAGTIAIERALDGAYGKVIGGDVEESVIRAAKSNVDASRRSVDLAMWNVSAIALKDNTVDRIVCNLPFGKQMRSRLGNQRLYANFFREAARISRPGGRAVVLTSERELASELIYRHPSIDMERYLRIDLLGIRAYIYVMNIR